MARSLSVALVAAAALAGGCLPSDFLQIDPPVTGAAVVPNSPFATQGPVVARSGPSGSNLAATAPEAVAVDKVGQTLLTENPSIGIKPLFLTIIAPQPEIFHKGTGALIITSPLVKQCKSEGQLAALLSVELGRMVSEREVLASPETHNPERRPPIAIQMGNAGQFSGLEQLQQAEIDKLNCDRPRANKKFIPPDPQVLARGYLTAAGFDPKELAAVAPLLDQAEKTFVLEKQFKGPSDTPTWAPR